MMEARYDMERAWNSGGKTLCAPYAKDACFGFMVILGADERERFEQHREGFSAVCRAEYDAAAASHDGKWLMLYPTVDALPADMEKLLRIKRKPNRKGP